MRTIVLTGATGGLGSCFARQLHSKDDTELICLYRNREKYQSMIAKEEITCMGRRTSDSDDFSTIGAYISDDTEEVVLILNAFSISPIKVVGTYTVDEVENMVNGNVKQIVMIVNAMIDYCKKHKIALRIINLDSGAADFPLKGWANYCASKSYVNAFLAVVALENPDIKIVSVDPGVMDTNMQETIRGTSEDIFDKVGDFVEYKDSNKLRSPEDVARFIIRKYIWDWNCEGFREKVSL